VENAILQAVNNDKPIQMQTTKPLMQTTKPLMRTEDIVQIAHVTPPKPAEPRVVSRASTSDQDWSVQVGAYGTKYEAEKALLKSALSNLGPLDNAKRRISPATVNGARLYRARFVGLSQADANKTCSRLRARLQTCVTVSPGS
jgi:D-alanyl-D-alanine carboxypeptidase